MSYTKFILLSLIFCISGCVQAKLSGTGVNVQDPIHAISVQANSVNAEVDVNAAD